jgi:hypothetical protein
MRNRWDIWSVARDPRNWGWRPGKHIWRPISIVCLLGTCLPAGCGFRNYAAPVLEPPLSAATQAQGVTLVNEFINDLNLRDYASAQKMLAPGMQPNWAPAHAVQYMKSSGYWMLVGSRNWKYNQVQGLKHGREMVVHAQFYNDPKNMLYHTNFSFARSGNTWLIDFIMNPVEKTRPKAVHISITQAGRTRS